MSQLAALQASIVEDVAPISTLDPATLSLILTFFLPLLTGLCPKDEDPDQQRKLLKAQYTGKTHKPYKARAMRLGRNRARVAARKADTRFSSMEELDEFVISSFDKIRTQDRQTFAAVASEIKNDPKTEGLLLSYATELQHDDEED